MSNSFAKHLTSGRGVFGLEFWLLVPIYWCLFSIMLHKSDIFCSQAAFSVDFRTKFHGVMFHRIYSNRRSPCNWRSLLFSTKKYKTTICTIKATSHTSKPQYLILFNITEMVRSWLYLFQCRSKFLININLKNWR